MILLHAALNDRQWDRDDAKGCAVVNQLQFLLDGMERCPIAGPKDRTNCKSLNPLDRRNLRNDDSGSVAIVRTVAAAVAGLGDRPSGDGAASKSPAPPEGAQGAHSDCKCVHKAVAQFLNAELVLNARKSEKVGNSRRMS